eukprot:1310973-Prymnesium_polylepis.3
MTVKGAHAVRQTSWPLQRAVRSDTEHAKCDARLDTRPGGRRRSSFMHPPEPPAHAADTPRPTQPTLPQKAVRGARARSSQHQLHIARR